MGPVNGGRAGAWRRFARTVPVPRRTSLQELTMADLAFVVATVALFTVVALVAKGVTKL